MLVRSLKDPSRRSSSRLVFSAMALFQPEPFTGHIHRFRLGDRVYALSGSKNGYGYQQGRVTAIWSDGTQVMYGVSFVNELVAEQYLLSQEEYRLKVNRTTVAAQVAARKAIGSRTQRYISYIDALA
jgi:hypothetical protein